MPYNYYEMPDQATQDQIKAMGGTINIVPRPGATATPPTAYTFDNVQGTPLPGNLTQQNMNPLWYGSDASADQLAQLLGGSVIHGDPFGATYPQGAPGVAPQANMIQLPNGRVVNAGIVGDIYNRYQGSPLLDYSLARELSGGMYGPDDPLLSQTAPLASGGQVNWNPTVRPPNVPPQIITGYNGIPGWADYSPQNQTWSQNGQPFTPNFSGLPSYFQQNFQTYNPTGTGNQPGTTTNPANADAGMSNLFVTPSGGATPSSGSAGNGTSGADNGFGSLFGGIGWLQGAAENPDSLGTNWQSALNGAFHPDTALTNFMTGGDLGRARTMADTGYGSIDQTPAWQSMVDAQQRNIARNGALLGEQFNSSGNRFSTSFGNAATDYYSQAAKDQNAALLGAQTQALEQMMGRRSTGTQLASQLGLQASGQLSNYDLQQQLNRANLGINSMEGAANRWAGVIGQLGQMGYGAGSQLAGQDFQSQMTQRAQALQAAQQLAQGSDYATNLLGQFGSGAANNLWSGSITGAQGLWGTENNAANQMYQGAMGSLPQLLQYDQSLRQMALGGASNLSQLWQSNLGLGNQMYTGQYGTLQDQINRMYQEYIRTDPMYNPMIPYMYSAATGYAPQQMQQTPGFWDYFSGILGAGLGAAGMAAGGGAFSDRRVKKDIKDFDEVVEGLERIPSVNYKYVGTDTEQTGVIAQDVQKIFPEAVVMHPNGILAVRYDLLAAVALNEIRRLKKEAA